MRRASVFIYWYLPWALGIALMISLLSLPMVKSWLYPPQRATITVTLPDVLIQDIWRSPRFPGCAPGPAGDACADERLQTYLYGHTAFPADPDNTGQAGLMVMQVSIDRTGQVSDFHLLRDPGYERGADALRLFKQMQTEDVRWEPAVRNGYPVAADIYLKIRYSNFRWAR